jgi:hypothetical protein
MGIDMSKMIELQVDEHECLQRYANEKCKEFGGNTSVRSSEKAILIFGKDESVYSQFSFRSRQWVGSCRERELLFLSLMVLV